MEGVFLCHQGRLDAVNLQKAVEYVLLCMNFDGGFGCRPGSESHAGQVSSTGLLSLNSFSLFAKLWYY